MITLKELEFKGKLAALMIDYDVVFDQHQDLGLVLVSTKYGFYLSVKQLAEELKD